MEGVYVVLVPVRVLQREAMYKSYGSGRLLSQSTIVVFWPSWYRPAFYAYIFVKTGVIEKVYVLGAARTARSLGYT